MPDALDQLTPSGDALDALSPTDTSASSSYWGDVVSNLVPSAMKTVGEKFMAPVENAYNIIFNRQSSLPLGPGPNATMKDILDWQTKNQDVLPHPFGPKDLQKDVQNVKNLPENFRDNPVGVAASVLGGGVNLLGPFIGGSESVENEGLKQYESAATDPSIKKLTEAVQPSRVPQFQQGASTAIPAMREFESTVGPLSHKNWQAAEQLAEAKRDAAAQTFEDAARQRGQKIDPNIIANAKIDAIPAGWRTDPRYRPQYEAAINDANTVRKRGPISLDDALGELQTLNAQVSRYHQMTPDQQYQADASGKTIADLESEAQGYRDAIARAVDPEHEGAAYQQIQRERRDLINFRQNMQLLGNKIEKQYTPTTAQNAGQTLSDLGALWHGNYREALASKMRQAPQLQDMVNAAFKNYKGPDLPETPTHAGNPVIPASHQLPPATIRLPGSDATSVRVTTGRPLDQFYPVEITSPGPYPTKQGDLFQQSPTFPMRKDLSERLRNAYDIVMGRE